MSERLASLRAAGVALAALLRRDLSAGRRGATVASARLVVVAASGFVAVVALINAQHLYGQPEAAGVAGWSLAWILQAIALLMLPVLALQAMRQDRESGTLELLLLAGLSPQLLAFGRWLSTFLLLEALLLDALPAMVAFAFFGAPNPVELFWGLLALTGWNAALAGLAVYLSSAIRRAGVCLFLAVFLLLLITTGSVAAIGMAGERNAIGRLPAAPPFLLAEMTFRRIGIANLPPMEPLRHLGGLAAMLGVGSLLAVLAGQRLVVQSRPAAARRQRRPARRRLADRLAPPRLRDWPLTWLLQRSSATARPFALALALPIPLAAMAIGFEVYGATHPTSLNWQDALDPSVLVTLALLLWGAGLLLALFSSALQVSRARERNEWDCLLASARSGRALVLDLLAGPGAAAAVMLALAAMLFLSSALAEPRAFEAEFLSLSLAVIGAIAGSGLLMLGLGFVSGLTARSQAGALGLAILLLLAAATFGFICAVMLEGTFLGQGFDLGSRLSAVVLAASLVLPLQFWLLERSKRRPGPGRLFFELLLCASLLAPPLVHGLFAFDSSAETFAMAALAAAALGLPLIVVTLRRPDFWLGRTG